MARTTYLYCCDKVQAVGTDCVHCHKPIGRVRIQKDPRIQGYSTDQLNKNKDKRGLWHNGLNEYVPAGEGRKYIERRTMEKYGVMPVWDSDPRKLHGKRVQVG